MGVLVKVRDRLNLPGLATRVYRSAAGLWFPEVDHLVGRRQPNVLALLRRIRGPEAGRLLLIPAANIITNDGDVFLAQRGAAETPTNAFTTWEMGSAGTPGKTANRSAFTAIGSSQLAEDTGYPKTNDNDADNSGAGTDIRTSRASYSAASFSHAAITHGWITNPTPGASEPILAGWAWASSINKTTSDTLKTFHNTDITGV